MPFSTSLLLILAIFCGTGPANCLRATPARGTHLFALAPNAGAANSIDQSADLLLRPARHLDRVPLDSDSDPAFESEEEADVTEHGPHPFEMFVGTELLGVSNLLGWVLAAQLPPHHLPYLTTIQRC